MLILGTAYKLSLSADKKDRKEEYMEDTKHLYAEPVDKSSDKETVKSYSEYTTGEKVGIWIAIVMFIFFCAHLSR